MTLIEKAARAMRSEGESDERVDEWELEIARAAVAAVFGWQLTQSRHPVVLNSLAAMRKEALGDDIGG